MKTVLNVLSSDGQARNRQLALVGGARRLGYVVEDVREDQAHHPKKDYDFAICGGIPKSTRGIRELLRSRGTDLLVVELGYLKRSNGGEDLDGGYFQLNWNGLCVVPDISSTARFETLQLKVEPKRTRPGSYILLAAQVGGDTQHRMSSSELSKWLEDEAKALRKKLNLPVVWRPHPKQPDFRPHFISYKDIQNPKVVSLRMAIEQARIIITYNSTLGVDAMLQGVHVISSPRAHYHDYAVEDYATRVGYLYRLANAQWNLKELGSGEAIEEMLRRRG